MPDRIVNNRERGRFETEVEGHLAVLDYIVEGEVVRMTHVGVPEAVGGRGIAGDLTRTALDWVRREGLAVRPECPYVKAWIEKHPDHSDLVA